MVKENVGNSGLEVTIQDLLSDRFMQKFTSFKSLDDFFKNSPFAEKYEADEAIEPDELNLYVSSNSDFENWEEMIRLAYIDYFAEEHGAVIL
ncbi:hypothetical protein V1499_23055 (plasmid) [Neobacillus sp. SCS-31]|uniref:hypothetical protein n=1 Tax=Neobacillus oceani TaxID=3115292 RepID=UPI003905A5B6